MNQRQPIVKEQPLRIVTNPADQGPAIRRLLAEHDLDAEKIPRFWVWVVITREDIAREVAKRDASKAKQDVATEQNTISTVAYSSRSENAYQ